MDTKLIPFWNQKEVTPPSIQSEQLLCKNPIEMSKQMTKTLDEIIFEFTHTNSKLKMYHEFIIKIKQRFGSGLRSDKGYKSLKKLNKNLQTRATACDTKPIIKVRKSIKNGCGPSLQMMQWILVLLQRAFHVFITIHDLSLKTVDLLKNRFYNGHHWHIAVFISSILSQIWKFSGLMNLAISTIFQKCYNFLPYLSSTKENWLPENYTLPSALSNCSKYSKSLNHIQRTFQFDIKETKIEKKTCVLSTKISEDTDYLLFKNPYEYEKFLRTERKLILTNSSAAKLKPMSKEEWSKFCEIVLKSTNALKLLNKDSREHFLELVKVNKFVKKQCKQTE